MRPIARAVLPIWMLALAPVAQAQDRPTLALRGDAAVLWLRQETAPGVVERLRGPALAAEARVNSSRFVFGASLLEGSLDALGARHRSATWSRGASSSRLGHSPGSSSASARCYAPM